MDPAETIESLVAWWKADGRYAPDAPATTEAVAAFADWHRQRLGSDPPPAFMRFLTLAEGGQYDAYYLFALADIVDATEPGLPFTVIGDSGNVDRFILRPDGSCAIVSLFDYDQVFEEFPDFARLLARLLHGR